MSRSAPRNIALTIGGRSQVIAVPPEEEAHVRKLAAMVDERVRRLGLTSGQSETRMLLIAALTLADELLSAEAKPAPPPPPPPADLLARIADLAERVEKLAGRLEQSATNP